VPVRGSAIYPFQVESALSRSEDGRNIEFALVRRAVEPQTLEVRLLRPANLTADAGAAIARRLQQHLAAELDLPTQVSFHDDLPRVGYKTLRVIDETSA
jgi:phenylacetate-coenzyme A ligase PaaK-like adenylate-forming protein